jgi:hypothetical protein
MAMTYGNLSHYIRKPWPWRYPSERLESYDISLA